MAVAAAIAVGVVTSRDRDEAVTTGTATTAPVITVAAVLTAPVETTSPPGTSPGLTATTQAPLDTVPLPTGAVEIGPSTEFVWGDGAILGAYVDGRFVPHDLDAIRRGEAPPFVAPPLPDPAEVPPEQIPVELVDRTASGFDYQVYDEGCGAIIVSPAFTPFPDASSGGWLATPNRAVATLDGSAEEPDPDAVDAAIVAAGVPASRLASIERLTPTRSLDADPSLETFVFRYGEEIVGPERTTWLAVFDPDTATLLTIAGDPIGDGTPFATNGEGPVDADGDGNLEITITSGARVELVRLIDGARLATAERCRHTLDVAVRFHGFGDEPVGYTISAASSGQTFSGEVSGDGGTAGPITFELPLQSSGTYVWIDGPTGRIEWEEMLRASRNVLSIDVSPDGATETTGTSTAG